MIKYMLLTHLHFHLVKIPEVFINNISKLLLFYTTIPNQPKYI